MFEFVVLARRTLDSLLPGRHQSMLLILAIALLILAILQDQDRTRFDDILSRATSQNLRETSLQPAADPQDLDATDSTKETDPDPRMFLTVKPGDNLSLIFKRAGLGATEVYEVANSSEDAEILANLSIGDQLAFELDQDQQLNSLELFKSPLESFLFTRTDTAEFDFSKINRKPHIEIVYKDAVITDSLFMAAQRGGIEARMTLELASLFGGVIDFMMDSREGDTFSLLFEEEYLDGELIGTGQILAASYTNQGVEHTALRYENSHGESNFFNPEGESMRKAFLKNPVDFTRISSNFSLARKHPILNTIRAHKGTDYAAPTGTPVLSTADGRVTFADRNGSFGKLVVIQHGDRFETKYAHLNAYAKGITAGTRVKQGQIIGYVGSTGSATGPHLHFEFLMDGVHRNSITIHDQLPKAATIPKAEMANFKKQTNLLLSMLKTHGASLESGNPGAQ